MVADPEEQLLNLPRWNKWQIIVVSSSIFMFCRTSLGQFGFPTFVAEAPNGYYCRGDNASKTIMDIAIANKSEKLPHICYVNGSESACSIGWEYIGINIEDSIITQWDLVCSSDYLVALEAQANLLGGLVASIFLSNLADRFGRRPVILIGLAMHILIGVGLIASFHIAMYIPFRFLQGCTNTMIMSAQYVLLTEWISTKNRAIIVNSASIGWTMGIILIAPVAMLIHPWRYLVLAYTIVPCLVVIPLYWFLPESLFYLNSKGQTIPDLEMTTRPAALEAATQSFVQKSEKESQAPTEEPVKQMSIISLLKCRTMLFYSLALFTLQLTLSMAYYTATVSSTQLSGDQYVNFLLQGAIEVPFAIASIIVSLKLPRLIHLFVFYAIAGVALLVGAFLPMSFTAVVVVCIGRGGLAGAYVVQPLYVAESFPTAVRNVGNGIAQMGDSIGALIGPALFLIEWSEAGVDCIFFPISIIILADLFLLAFLPETKDLPLANTLMDIEKRHTCGLWRSCRKDRHVNKEPNSTQLADL